MLKKCIIVILTGFAILTGCISFDIGFIVKPAQPPIQKKPEPSPPSQKVEPVETAPTKEEVEKLASPST